MMTPLTRALKDKKKLEELEEAVNKLIKRIEELEKKG